MDIPGTGKHRFLENTFMRGGVENASFCMGIPGTGKSRFYPN
jgi:hypothetical protein